MKLSKKFICLALIIALIPLAVYAYCYPELPEQVATHFDFSGNANGFTSREGLWLPLITPLWLIPLLVIVPHLDPRGKSYEKLGKFYPAFILGLTIFLSGLMTALVLNALPNIMIPIEKVTLIAVGLLFLVLGNYMPKLHYGHQNPLDPPQRGGVEQNPPHRRPLLYDCRTGDAIEWPPPNWLDAWLCADLCGGSRWHTLRHVLCVLQTGTATWSIMN